MSASPKKDLRAILYVFLAFGVVLLIVNLYYSNYTLISLMGVSIDSFDRFLSSHPGWVYFETFSPRLFALIFATTMIFYPGYSCVGRIKTNILVALACGCVFVAVGFLPYSSYFVQCVRIFVGFGSYLGYVIFMKRIASWFSLNSVSLDENKKVNDGFDQNTTLIETEHSVNIKYKFRKNEEWHDGWINFISLFRATSVIGMPGTGKSYGFLQQIMRQTIFKGFCGVIYDYKDPTLSTSTYNYYLAMKEEYPDRKMRFGYISFQHLNKTYRCNPLKGIDTVAEARDVAFTILASLNPQTATKQGDFFVESSISFVALNIYLLGVVNQGKYLSLPHVISALSMERELIFSSFALLAVFDSDVRSIFSPFQSAYKSGAVQQLEGQIASAQIGLSGIADKGLSYVMTEDEDEQFNINLDLNSFDDPKIICLGNDPSKDKTYGLACSVYLARISKMINKKGVPCLYLVDELPTVYVKGIDNLIATARSNYVAVTLGYQDHTQIIRDYGNTVAEAIINTTANTVSGAVKGKTAQTLAQSFGDKIVVKKNASRDSEGKISNTFSETKEKRIPQEKIEELSQGEFVGRVVDTFKNKTNLKVFDGEIHVPDFYKDEPHTIPALRNLSDAEIGKTLAENQVQINNQVNSTFVRIKEASNKLLALRNNTCRGEENTTLCCLEDYIDDPDNVSNVQGLSLWCELAHVVIKQYDKLDLKDNYLSVETKIENLLRYTWVKTEIYEQVMSSIRSYGFLDHGTAYKYTIQMIEEEGRREDDEDYRIDQ